MTKSLTYNHKAFKKDLDPQQILIKEGCISGNKILMNEY